jgi:hypothetical protein
MSRAAHLAFVGAGIALSALGLWLWQGQGALIWIGGMVGYCG